ncbi:hypothetical protein L596_018280 [Steinernema carpocapsae]|uniref:Uncharacterized protein n=1 Tax=Steinernema carpocapsae TaxID=34508 RepID=A0A4U5N4H0_STECR|nr:hypothetical protein L596_018280 [Steinernema carpocapsae]
MFLPPFHLSLLNTYLLTPQKSLFFYFQPRSSEAVCENSQILSPTRTIFGLRRIPRSIRILQDDQRSSTVRSGIL